MVGSEQEGCFFFGWLYSMILNLSQPASIGTIEVNWLSEFCFPHFVNTPANKFMTQLAAYLLDPVCLAVSDYIIDC